MDNEAAASSDAENRSEICIRAEGRGVYAWSQMTEHNGAVPSARSASVSDRLDGWSSCLGRYGVMRRQLVPVGTSRYGAYVDAGLLESEMHGTYGRSVEISV